jgi:hypothetical protein
MQSALVVAVVVEVQQAQAVVEEQEHFLLVGLTLQTLAP